MSLKSNNMNLPIYCSAVLLALSSMHSFSQDYPVVQMLKRNADSFAIDGSGSSSNDQDVYLWSESETNANQQWWEIDRGNGYFTYQKFNTDFCLDGGNEGENAQNVKLWTCRANNQNQHWQKVDVGGGHYQLIKRNASGYALDGNKGGENYQSIYLWSAGANNQNQHWFFNYVSGASEAEPVIETAFDDGSGHVKYPAMNVIDGDTSFESRWAGYGPPASVTVQLQDTALISEVGVAWARGDQRSYEYEVHASSNNGASWTQIYDGESSGTTPDIEYVDVTDIQANQVRITVLSNSAGTQWADITEVAFNGEVTEIEDPYPGCEQVNSLAELQSYTDVSNTCVRMMPGTYAFDTNNSGDGKLFSNPYILQFTGSNNRFVFDGVKFTYDTDIFSVYGNVGVTEFHVAGDNNVFEKLIMEDLGDSQPRRTALGVLMDGFNNRIEDFHLTTRGSYPYGYGDHFGKGSGYIIKHYKHSGVLIRGVGNQLIDSTLIMRTYGHGIFVQGGDEVLIDGVYVEGELGKTDDILAEEGTGSAADQVDFMTVFGFPVKPGYRFSKNEDGIRAYNSGWNYETGESVRTGSITVLNSTVKFMRTGVTVPFAGGDKYVENCTAIGTELGFSLGFGGEVVNSRGDASVGPIYEDLLDRHSNVMDLTLLDNAVPKLGDFPSIYIAGSGHNITLKDGTTSYESGISLQVGGVRNGFRHQEGTDSEPPSISANNITFDNQTPYPVHIYENSSNATVSSCGSVTDEGSATTLLSGNNCD